MSTETAEVQADPVAKPVEKLPPWLPPLLGFIIGSVVMYGVMQPINSTPDYQRGHDVGYRHGFTDGMQSVETETPLHNRANRPGRK